MVGVVLGNSVLNIIPLELATDLSILASIVMGLIGFDMGGHQRLKELRRLGRSITLILLFEAIGTFILISLGM
jgi:NhaP-type Na+/H+ or K+/H+ antiporter